MTISCPRCGLDFETQATTATLCRSCRHVIHVGSAPSARIRRTVGSAPEYRADTAGGTALVLAAAGLFLAFYVVPRVVRAVRRRCATTARTSRRLGPEAGLAPPAATDEPDATLEHTGPNQAGSGPLA